MDHPALWGRPAMTTLPLPVDDETVAAYEAATEERREKAAQVASALFKAALRIPEQTKREKVDALIQTMEELSAQARANGWTDEMNEALLRGDFDDE